MKKTAFIILGSIAAVALSAALTATVLSTEHAAPEQGQLPTISADVSAHELAIDACTILINGGTALDVLTTVYPNTVSGAEDLGYAVATYCPVY